MSPKTELVRCAASTSSSAVPCCLIMLLLVLLMQGFEMIEIIVDVENCLQVHYLIFFCFHAFLSGHLCSYIK